MTTTPQVWFRANNGDWNGDPSADPDTLTGGFDITSLGGSSYLPFLGGNTAFLGEFIGTANFGASAFAFTPPTTSIAWGSGLTWNPLDKSSTNMALSPDNLTASFGRSATDWIRGSAATGGLQYFEVAMLANWQNVYVGLSIPGATISVSGSPGAGVGTITLSDAASGSVVIGSDTTLATGLGVPGNGAFTACICLSSGTTPPPDPPAATPAVVIPESLGLWRGQVGINWQGMALVGDAFTNVIGLSDFTIFTEFGNQMLFVATTPPIHRDRKRVSITRMELEVEAGLGIPNDPTTPPLMLLDYSKDGGVTWVPLQVFRSMGAAGEYIRRLRWIGLGNSRTWVFRFSYSDSARPTIIGCYYDAFFNLG